MTENPEDRFDADTMQQPQDNPESGHGRSGSGAPVSEDPTGDAEYRGADDQDAGPIFVDTPDGEQEYGRTTR
jgi:hypothetical protein